MKTVLAVIGVLAAVVLLPLIIPLKVKVKYKGGESFVSIRYFLFKRNILPVKEKEIKEKAAQTPKKTEKEVKKAKEKPNIKELLPVIADALPKCIAPVRKLLKRTTIADLDLYMVVVGEDAADTAIKFGRMNALVFPALKLASEIFTLRYDRAEIIPGFTAEREYIEFSADVRILPLSAVIAAVNIMIIALGAFIRARKNKSVERKSQNGKEQPAHQ